MTEQRASNQTIAPSPWSFFRSFSMPTTLFFFITWLVWLEYGHQGLKILLWGIVALFIGTIVFFIYDYGIKTSERQIDLGAKITSRSDYVDAIGDAMKMQAQAGKSVKVVEPKQLEQQVEEMFNIIPFAMPSEVSNK